MGRVGAGVVAAAGQLDFDHIGAQIGQHHGGVGANEDTSEVENAQAVERLGHGGLFRRRAARSPAIERPGIASVVIGCC